MDVIGFSMDAADAETCKAEALLRRDPRTDEKRWLDQINNVESFKLEI